MPELRRPDGVDIWWEEVGQGPAIVLCHPFNLSDLNALVERLAPERRVIRYEPRGVGRSSPSGPYDLETGKSDLEALLEETGPATTAFAIGDGAHRAIRVADERPDLLERVVITSTGLGEREAPGFSGSTQVLQALMSLMRRDYRSGLRQMVSGSSQDEEYERVRADELATRIPQEAAIGYLEAWIVADSIEVGRRLGNRLTILAYPGNHWFPLEQYEDMSISLSDAEYEEVEDGPISRPDLAADLLLRLSAAKA